MQYAISIAACSAAMILFASCLQSSGANNDRPGDNPQQDTSSHLIRWTVKAGNTYFNEKDSRELYLYVSLKTGQPRSIKKRVPLNISLVLDRSGSMSGDKIDYARKAAKFVVDQLSADDYLSIVNYDDVVEVTSASQPVKNKEALKMAIDKLMDRGSTNLSGGLLEGYNQVKKTMNEGFVNRVLILTDGLANQGIVEPDKLKQLVHKKYAEDGMALSTFGLGADYDERLLTLLAETGHANYYFIHSADKIPSLFASELKGLLNVVAQNAIVEIPMPGGLKCEKVYGYPFEVKDNKIVVKLNDLYANDEKSILIKLTPGRRLEKDLTFDCRLLYTDAADFTSVYDNQQVTMSGTDDEKKIKAHEDKEVSEMLALFEATDDFDDILVKVDADDYNGAKEAGMHAVNKLKEKQLRYKSPKIQRQVDDMESYLNSLDSVRAMKEEEKKLYQKSNKATNYKTIKGKR